MKKTTFYPSMFPLEVVPEREGWCQIWTRKDDTPGSMNCFAVIEGIQHRADAEAICEVLNANKDTLCR